MSAEGVITKENLDFILKELGKEFRRRNGTKTPAEIILVGGAAVLASYGFREMTTDIDAIITASSAMKDAINAVGDRYSLPNGWLNTDFRNTASYSNKLEQHSEYYRTFSNILTVRTVRAEYLIAMKLMSGRRYKKDLSDIVGILYEQQKHGDPLSFDRIDNAVTSLYGSWANIAPYARTVLEKALAAENLPELFETQVQQENEDKETIVEIDRKYPNTVNADNINEIIAKARDKKGR